MTMTMFRITPFFLLFLFVVSCATTAGTGRRQLNLMSVSQEMKLGRQAYREILRDEQARIEKRGPDAVMVQEVGQAIARAAEHWRGDKAVRDLAYRFDWEFTLLDDPETLNAFVLPGGKCCVYSGILSICEGEDGLAVILGHEVSHAILRHGGERISHEMVFSAAMLAGDALWDAKDEEKKAQTLALLGVGGQMGIMLPFSRSHESEADEFGLYLAAAAGYDPREAVALWRRMAKEGSSSTPEWLSTHPAEKTRIKRLKEAMPKALRIWKRTQSAPAP